MVIVALVISPHALLERNSNQDEWKDDENQRNHSVGASCRDLFQDLGHSKTSNDERYQIRVHPKPLKNFKVEPTVQWQIGQRMKYQ